MTRKVGRLIDLKQKLGDLQVGHEGEGFLFELLRLLGNGFLQGTYLKQLTRNFCVRQFTLTRDSIDLVQLLLEECKTRLQITVAEKRGKEHEVPVHSKAKEAVDLWLERSHLKDCLIPNVF